MLLAPSNDEVRCTPRNDNVTGSTLERTRSLRPKSAKIWGGRNRSDPKTKLNREQSEIRLAARWDSYALLPFSTFQT